MTGFDDKSKEANRNEGSKEKGKVKSKKSARKKKNSKKDEGAELMSTFFEKQGSNKNDDDEECSEKNEDDEDTDEFWAIDKLYEAKKEKGRWLIKLRYVGYDKFYWQPIGDLSEGCSK